jgi:hypothetical protein
MRPVMLPREPCAKHMPDKETRPKTMAANRVVRERCILEFPLEESKNRWATIKSDLAV